MKKEGNRMDSHEKGRILMNSKNKLLIFLGAYLAVGTAFLCFCARFVNFKGCCSNFRSR